MKRMLTFNRYAITVVGAAIGEGACYLTASGIELVLLGELVHHARTLEPGVPHDT